MSSFNSTIPIQSMQFGNGSITGNSGQQLPGSISKKSYKHLKLTNSSSSSGGIGFGKSSVIITYVPVIDPGETVTLDIEDASDLYILSTLGGTVYYSWVAY